MNKSLAIIRLIVHGGNEAVGDDIIDKILPRRAGDNPNSSPAPAQGDMPVFVACIWRHSFSNQLGYLFHRQKYGGRRLHAPANRFQRNDQRLQSGERVLGCYHQGHRNKQNIEPRTVMTFDEFGY